MRILISGASGLVGSHLAEYMSRNEYEVIRLVRSDKKDSNSIKWDPSTGFIEISDLMENLDVAVHLSGENIVGRWTENKKQIIRDSRVESTKILVKRFSELKKPPKCFICASAIGYYGNKGSEELDENSGPDTGFLPEICIDWEKEANKSNDLGIRVVNLRIGVVLSSNGGALGKMLTPFKLGLGGMVGDGKQYWSWVSIDDMSRIIKFAAENNNISGPLNAVSPNPVTNKEFTTILASVLKRPAILNVPSFFIKLIFGEMGKHGILSSTRVLPKKLLDNGYNFQHSNLKLALIDILKK